MSLSKLVGPLHKKANLRSDSLGNCDIFHELQRKKTRSEFTPTESRSNEEILAQLQSYGFGRRCCERHLFNGCFLNAFRDVSGAVISMPRLKLLFAIMIKRD